MSRQDYIRRTLTALCGSSPADPATYHLVSAMADRIEGVFKFDKPTFIHNKNTHNYVS